MSNILIIYSTTDGHTLEICRYLQKVIEKDAHQVQLISVNDWSSHDLNQFDKIIVGASIRYGKHSAQIYRFVRKNKQLLDSKLSAFFSVNVVARKPEKNKPDTNPYLKKFLKQIDWKPKELAVFAGRLDYPSYSYWDRQIIRFIMLITKGPTARDTIVEYTNWQDVESFGIRISRM